MSYSVIRTHEICAGHRVVGHESKCRHLHGHNYKFHFKVAPKIQAKGMKPKAGAQESHMCLDSVGRVIDFSVVKSTLCEWLENNWDHKFLYWARDELINGLRDLASDLREGYVVDNDHAHFIDSLVQLPFNPTAENLAAYMVEVIGPELLDPYGVELVECRIEETSKCHVEYTK
jgi:6-pyruvoyltetrahydropterin/6-carboxytetrahydropterin synthase